MWGELEYNGGGGNLESAFKVPTPIWLKESEYDSNLVKTIHNSAI